MKTRCRANVRGKQCRNAHGGWAGLLCAKHREAKRNARQLRLYVSNPRYARLIDAARMIEWGATS